MRLSSLASLLLLAATTACGASPGVDVTLRDLPITSAEGVLTTSGVEFDAATSSDGNGSLRLSASEPTVFRLFELDDLEVENTRLVYRARIRTEEVDGQVYLEMWCRFPGKGEFFSRALQAPLRGSTEWTTQETPFFLEAGQKPDLVKLNLVVDGSGTAWIDDVRLLAGG